MFSNIKGARLLGLTSLGVGAIELLATRRLEKAMGVQDHAPLIRSYGLREIAAGLTILNQPGLNKSLVGGLWSRVLGDVVDILTLAAAAKTSRNRDGLAAITGVVLAVTAADLVVAAVAQTDLLQAATVSKAAKARVIPTGAVPRVLSDSPSNRVFANS